MSIYTTLALIHIENEWDTTYEVWFQGVPAHVDFECDYLPGPLQDASDDNENLRAVVVVLGGEPKGGNGYGGQQYHEPLVMMDGREWKEAKFWELLQEIRERIEERKETP